MRSPEEITTIINGFDLTCREGVDALEAKVRSELSLYEIDLYCSYLHGGRFTSKAGWTRDHAGRVAPTEREDRLVMSLWVRLLHDTYSSLGAAAAVEMHDARLRGRTFYTDEGEKPDLWLMTLDEIAKRIPDGVKARIERDLKPERNKREQQAAAIGGDVAKKDRQLAEGVEIVTKLMAEIADLKARLAKYE